ncbi:hypothetical protein PBI_SMARTIES_68 [Microbacterium phage Smarties]|uniref:Uncharacterized protein n=1 Tax=Microbacterium phage Ariadne TaxID=2656546 RepID=A0A649VBS7_9CAUD|nr:hypothetical protein QDA10_gp068 [Microbacterium phage Ariadne]QGJ89505.1 hypothetical protein PBI_ARIADNE_68 [Microbacterium phage Ariadne]QGJ91491.1 hypothetical protein PBI_SMARTIES_68 [Microbacterium phage Smarties]
MGRHRPEDAPRARERLTRRHPGGQPPLPARMSWGMPLGNGDAAGERRGDGPADWGRRAALPTSYRKPNRS